MGLSFLRDVYDLDTLDTRFTNASNVPYQTVIDARDDPASKEQAKAQLQSKAPTKWNTLEFYVYGVVIAFAVFCMFWIPYDVSRPSHPQFYKFEAWLSDGWIPGRKIDNTDPQYRTFRGNLPYMGLLLLLHPLLRNAWAVVNPVSPQKNHSGRARLDQRASFDFVFALIYLAALHGFSALKVLFILYGNYKLAMIVPKRFVPLATWAYAIGVLFANEMSSGYHYRNMASYVWPPTEIVNGAHTTLEDSALMRWGKWMDGYGGLISRWEILFNITVLRMISFNMDYYWSFGKRNFDSLEKKQLDPANLSDRDRVSISPDAREFSFRNHVAYTIYAPLYLTGPIMTFNDYISQCKFRSATLERGRTIKYAIRFVFVLLAMEIVLHVNYVGAISRAAPIWADYTASQLSLLSFINLHIIWLKLLIPWRFFRLWALVDGLDPPENMVRCVSNNYSTQLFWRAWHRSYNRWLVRYIYVPLGGSSFRNWKSTVRSIVTFLTVFTFVALWHDLEMRLLIWGWLIVLFMLPEWTGAWLFPKRKWESRPTEYRIICCIGGIINVLMMISANLVGFAVGVDGLETIIRSILRDWSGFLFISTSCICLFAGIQVMFEIRESEKRRGINVKC